MTITALVNKLKESNQDWEFYPTTESMLYSIYQNTRHLNKCSVLDIGCGNGKFKKCFDQFYKDDEKRGIRNNLKIEKYMVIEKSQILLNELDHDTFVVGTDFHTVNLLDKQSDIIFCNPPYSEFEEWMVKILKQAISRNIFMVIPDRWQHNENLKKIIKEENYTTRVIYSDNFLDGERKARANVDVVCFSRHQVKEEDIFNKWFKETFNVNETPDDRMAHVKEDAHKEEIKNSLVKGDNVAECLVDIYNNEMTKLYNSYVAIMSLDASIFKELNISIANIADTLKDKTKNLKTLYWSLVFDEMETITDKLTSASRKKMFEEFRSQNNVDFTLENIYAILIWICKNASHYYNNQLVDLFKEFSEFENVKKYKSNMKTFVKDQWRWKMKNECEHTHFTLDYRIIIENHRYAYNQFSYNQTEAQRDMLKHVKDIITIANNLGFFTDQINSKIDYSSNKNFFEYGEKNYIHKNDGEVLFEYKIFKNGNIHYKLNLEFCKAINVEAGRILGWLRNKSDVVNEFDSKDLKGAEKYFNVNANLGIDTAKTLMIGYKG